MPLTYAFATPNDRDELGDFLVKSFSTNGGPPFLFLERLPHLFTDERISEHALAKEDGTIIGCVGGYRFEFEARGISFDTCGIGQVATALSARGKGVMRSLMNTVLEKNRDCDFFWLYGDRRRYSYYGFELGGQFTEYYFHKRDLHKLTPAYSPEINVSTRCDTLLPQLKDSFTYLHSSPKERESNFNGKALKILSTEKAEILYSDNDQIIHYAWGDKQHLAVLFLHVIKEHRADDGIFHHYSENDTSSLHDLLPHFTEATLHTSANFRIGNLDSLLPKATRFSGCETFDSTQAKQQLSQLSPLRQSAAIFSPFPSQFPRMLDRQAIPSLAELHIPRIFAL